jgi:hypothetical protein
MKLYHLLTSLILCTNPSFAQDIYEVAFAKKILSQAQAKSFATQREYCGYIGITPAGRLKATPPTRGHLDSCYASTPPNNLEIIASYHTHAAFDPEADSEVPSSVDMLADMGEGVDGYIATPGGRVWFIDGQRGIARQICGVRCIISDKYFKSGGHNKVRAHYTLQQLQSREDNL